MEIFHVLFIFSRHKLLRLEAPSIKYFQGEEECATLDRNQSFSDAIDRSKVEVYRGDHEALSR